VGDRIEIDGYVLEVADVEGTRISTLRLHEAEADDEGHEDADAESRDE
jgi:CBS domain containing-hemolysin-like protein